MVAASRSPSSILEGRSRVPLACHKSQVLDFNLDSDFISLKLQLLRKKIQLMHFFVVVHLLFPLRNLRADACRPTPVDAVPATPARSYSELRPAERYRRNHHCGEQR
jgi:hypothetical protein